MRNSNSSVKTRGRTTKQPQHKAGNSEPQRRFPAAAGNDTLEVTGRLTKKPYRFKRIRSREEVVERLYSPPTLPNRESYELVKMIRDAADRADVEHEKLLKKGVITPKSACRVLLPIECLRANPEIAREKLIDWPHVADIAQDIESDALGVHGENR